MAIELRDNIFFSTIVIYFFGVTLYRANFIIRFVVLNNSKMPACLMQKIK